MGAYSRRRFMKNVATGGVLAASAGVFSACSSGSREGESGKNERTFVFGDTTFNAENEEADINPHNSYAGWACIRYGVGETLFHYSDSMEIEPWLALSYENRDELTWEITLRENVSFSSGRLMDAQAVKECLEHLIEVHARAAGDLSIDTLEADGQVLTITTTEPKPTLISYLSDPYGCIFDVEAGITDEGIVCGTGPYIAESLTTSEQLKLVKNENYWGGEPGLDEITVLTISDGDTLAMALQGGEIDGAYGMAYASYPLFENDDYAFSSCATSRAFFVHMNFDSEIIQDASVRRAIAMGIDKEGFVNTLLSGYGYPAVGVFPESFPFGGDVVTTQSYDPEGARELLEEAGWVDSDGDGIREKDGTALKIRWLTYPSRQELPLLAESVQATLKEIGIEVTVNSTADHNSIRQDRTVWDVYASAMVTAPTGDPAYFFTTHCLDSSSVNNGNYHSDALEELAAELSATFDTEERNAIAIEMQQVILDDNAFVFCSHLKMSMIRKASYEGLTAHPCDFYEITAQLRPVE